MAGSGTAGPIAAAKVPVGVVTARATRVVAADAVGRVTVARRTRAVLTSKAEHRRGVRGTLDRRRTAIEATEARAYNVTHARLGILMNAFS